MKKILVATDLSSRSDRAVLRAIKLSKEHKAKLVIFHVIDEETQEILIEQTKKIAHEEISYCIKGKTKDVKPEIKIVVGKPHSEILKLVSEEDIDLVILGLHRHTDSSETMVGKVIERVVRNSMRPVLVVKNRFESDYRNILVAVDFNNHSQKSLKLAFDLFSTCHFCLLHTYQMPFLGAAGKTAALEQKLKASCFEDIEQMIKVAIPKHKSRKPEITKKILQGSILDVLNDEINYSKPELLVLGSHARTGLSKMMAVNVTENFLSNPACDTLVVV